MSATVRSVLAVHAVLLGAGYLLGPPQFSTSSTFTVVKQLGVSVTAWGAVFLFAGVLLLARLDTVGHALALFALTFWGGCLGATVFTGELAGWGGPVHVLTLAVLHAYGLWRRPWRHQHT